jgi:hypothetical protein
MQKKINKYFQTKYDFESTLYVSTFFNPLTNIILTKWSGTLQFIAPLNVNFCQPYHTLLWSSWVTTASFQETTTTSS